MSAQDHAERFHPEDRAAWRKWLQQNHGSSAGVWLVSWRKHTGMEGPSYDDAVEEALCFGWIDSRASKLDDDRTMLWFSPRRPGSAWARPNKQRVERLIDAGLMTSAGQRVIDRARADGSWSRLDDVENLVVPNDLAEALASRPPARQNWDGFSRSVRRSILEWILQAKRDTTRAARIDETARLAQIGVGANQGRTKR
ncbi:MAG: YdeI/OmpD-associated family protein [Jiangellaceae bacterium]|nr:YdeI/OmpD-associated family protein [Jiangellaceae bacterium]